MPLNIELGIRSAITLFVFLSFHSGESTRMSSKEEELELEKHVRLLNKPAIKTIKDETGDIYNCIDIRKQPAFDHPLLKNHTIKFRPTSQPKDSNTRSTMHSGQSKTLQKGLGCPKGTVPIRHIQTEDLIKEKSFFQSYATTDGSQMDFAVHDAMIITRARETNYSGVEAYFNILNPKVDIEEQWSGAQVSIIGGPLEDLDCIQAGWVVSPQLYGDNKTRTFVFWQGNKEGCFNLMCSGYVQVSGDYPVGRPLPTRNYDEVQIEYPLQIYQDPRTKDWWLVNAQAPIHYGYFPKELFPYLEGGAPAVSLGGTTGRAPNQPSPPMGSGYFPDGHSMRAGYFRKAKIFKTSNYGKYDLDPSLTKTFVDAPKCYRVKDYGVQKDSGYTIMYGGPGNCGV